jgi:hypothetical protein
MFMRDIKRAAGGGIRFKAGQVADYPSDVWKQIAANLKLPLEAFTTDPVDVAAAAARLQTQATTARKPSSAGPVRRQLKE